VNTVHPTAVIGPGVQLGSGNTIGPYAVLIGPAHLGDGNWIGPHVVIGTPAEIRGIDHGDQLAASPGAVEDAVGTGVTIGHRNVLREFTTVHQGHFAQTVLGDDCYVMNKVYIAHDNVIGDRVTMASGVSLGGHVHVGADANLGMGTVVHQRRLIGPGVMVGMGAVVTRDVPPYALAYGNPSRVRGANRVGMNRLGVPPEAIEVTDQAYAGGDASPYPAGAMDDGSLPSSVIEAWAWWARELLRRA
jgi:UDP-N-acetylglucosamine acyltransferase